VRRLIESVTPKPLLKVFTTYEHPWWRAAAVKQGRVTTDLPVRQSYYWPRNNGKPPAEGRSMLMASYDDGLNVGFWDGFRPRLRPPWWHLLFPFGDVTEQPQWFQGSDIGSIRDRRD